MYTVYNNTASCRTFYGGGANPKTPEEVAADLNLAKVVDMMATGNLPSDGTITAEKQGSGSTGIVLFAADTNNTESTAGTPISTYLVTFTNYKATTTLTVNGSMTVDFYSETTAGNNNHKFAITIATPLSVYDSDSEKTHSVGTADDKALEGITNVKLDSTGTIEDGGTGGTVISMASTLVVDSTSVDASGIEGSGDSATDAYTFSTAAQLRAFAMSVNDGTLDTNGKFFALGAPITLSGEWTPIGTSEHPFEGSFDGNGKAITGLSIDDNKTEEGDYEKGGVGFFGTVSIAGNQTIENMNVSGSIKAYRLPAGGLIGRVMDSDENTGTGALSISESVNNVSVTGDNCAGGFVGYTDTTTNVTIVNCQNKATIKATGENTEQDDTTDDGKAGGIVGAMDTASAKLTLQNCTNSATITGGTTGTGGILGFGGYDLTVTNCTNESTGTVSGNQAGGIVGTMSPTNKIAISNSFNYANITGIESAGGIIGRSWGATGTLTYSIENCTTSGTINATGTTNDVTVGGIVARIASQSANSGKTAVPITASIKNCSFTGSITATTTNAKKGTILGQYLPGTESILTISLSSNGGSIGYINSNNVTIESGKLTRWPAGGGSGKITFKEGATTPDNDNPVTTETIYTYSNNGWVSDSAETGNP